MQKRTSFWQPVINPGNRVEAYRNLRSGTYSLRMRSNNRTTKVLDRPREVLLKDVTFAVQPAGREKARREKRKNVHAFVRGTLMDYADYEKYSMELLDREVYYNPYECENFVLKDKNVEIFEAEYAWLSPSFKIFV